MILSWLLNALEFMLEVILALIVFNVIIIVIAVYRAIKKNK